MFEAVMNSVQSIQDAPRSSRGHKITIEIERDLELALQDSARINAFKISDTGIGLNDDNFDSFNTSYSEYKAARGGKGLGRFIWLKAFERVEIDSVFVAPDV